MPLRPFYQIIRSGTFRRRDLPPKGLYSTVTLLARFLGLSMSQPRWRAT